MKWWSASMLACSLCMFPCIRSESVWDAQINPLASDGFTEARFRLWVDGDRPVGHPLQALIVLAPGWNGDARGLIANKDWQALARDLEAGLVGVRLRSDGIGENGIPYHRADKGSGRAWVRALTRLALDSRRTEVATVPWLLWGHSAGGQWAYGLSCVYPDRVAAFVAVKGGVYETPFNPLARGIPGLFVIGERDAGWRAQNITSIFEQGRRGGAAWALAWERNAGHEIGRSTHLARIFLREAFPLRIVRHAGKTTLRRLVTGEGVIGIRADYSVSPQWPKDERALVRTVWLPSLKTAAEWKRLGEKGENPQ